MDETVFVSLDTSQFIAGAQKGAQAIDQFKAHVASTATATDALQAQTVRAASAVTQVAAAKERGAGASRNWTQAIVAASYGISDMNYGLINSLNNVQHVIAMLGLGGGLAAALQVTLAGVQTLSMNWDRLDALWRSDETLKEAERMERLAAATNRTYEQTRQLLDLEDRKRQRDASAGAAKSLMGAEGPPQQQAAKGVGEAVTFQGDDRATGAKKLIDALMTDPKYLIDAFATKEDKARLKAAILRESSLRGSGNPAIIRQHEAAARDVTAERNQILDEIVRGNEKTGRAPLASIFGDPAAFGKQAQVEALKKAITDNRGAMEGQGIDVNMLLSSLKGSEDKRKEAYANLAKEVSEGVAGVFDKVKAGVKKEAEKAVREAEKSDKAGERLTKTVEGVFKAFDDGMERIEKAQAERDRVLEDRALKEKISAAQERQDQRAGAGPGALAADPDHVAAATNLLMAYRTSRRFGGAGMDQQQAEDRVFKEAYALARKNKFLGGGGMAPEKAAEFAQRTVDLAGPQAQAGLERAFAGVATTSAELKAVMQENVNALRDAIRFGVPPYLR